LPFFAILYPRAAGRLEESARRIFHYSLQKNRIGRFLIPPPRRRRWFSPFPPSSRHFQQVLFSGRRGRYFTSAPPLPAPAAEKLLELTRQLQETPEEE